MAVYSTGSSGPEVSQIQQQLQALGFYNGGIDGSYGPGTRDAVIAFQNSKALAADGTVGPNTWAALFGTPQPAPPSLAGQPLALRSLALTGSFETDNLPPACFAGLTGNFDGQGISFGVCQWNLGQGSLQPLLNEMNTNHPDVLQQVFGTNLAALQTMLGQSKAQQLAWAETIEDPVKHTVLDPWHSQFKALGMTPEFQAIQAAHAGGLYKSAVSLFQKLGLTSARGVALMFDIVVQNGSIDGPTTALIQQDFAALDGTQDPSALEVARMQIIARRRAAAANPKFAADVLSRKLTIANGSGTVHGLTFDLAGQFGLTLDPAEV